FKSLHYLGIRIGGQRPPLQKRIRFIRTAIPRNLVFVRRFFKGPRMTRMDANFGDKEKIIKQNNETQEKPTSSGYVFLALLPSVNGFPSEICVNPCVSRSLTCGCGRAALGHRRSVSSHRRSAINFCATCES